MWIKDSGNIKRNYILEKLEENGQVLLTEIFPKILEDWKDKDLTISTVNEISDYIEWMLRECAPYFTVVCLPFFKVYAGGGILQVTDMVYKKIQPTSIDISIW